MAAGAGFPYRKQRTVHSDARRIGGVLKEVCYGGHRPNPKAGLDRRGLQPSKGHIRDAEHEEESDHRAHRRDPLLWPKTVQPRDALH